MNKAILTGRICQEIELKQTTSGLSVCSFSLAVKRPRVKDTTDFLTVVCWRQSAEYLSRYAKKGDLIEVVGTIQSRKYEDQNGRKGTAIEIVADEVSILQSAQGSTQGSTESQPTFTPTTPNFEEIKTDDDLPF